MQRIAFANALRGIAALCVVIAHYILMFNYIRGEFGGLPALPETPFPAWMISVFNPLISLNVGAFGVALFFLISGLVIPISVASLCGKTLAKTKFAIGRLFRIWPTYIIGLTITLIALEIAARYMGYITSYTAKQVIIQMSLFRDWFGSSVPLDGVVWTLEVEIKFYLIVLLCWSMISKAKLFPLFALGIATVLAANFYPSNTYKTGVVAALVFPIKYVFFMMIGVAFNYHHRGLLSLEKLFALTVGMLCVFGYSCFAEGWQIEVIVSYFAAFALFTAFYLLARDWSGGPVFDFLANISYPLYACHGAFGIVGMRIMIDQGVGAVLALAIQIVATIILSWIIHKTVENPTHVLGKKLAMMISPPIAPIAVR
ncbi:Peptidoglycan/LPS O-acetylase OafA/YrhL, contains acyltransferase and SGNH-hydrolase domains [Pseudomonas sp. NFPP07]|uniref:acyltransferase family protein n=1 Tax=Pseudomonas TaxID=286 RepID=UPI0008F30FAF|nr:MULTISPECIES: acyltransferase [Pseudomonas]SFP91644.1 Peptidoglycan/LPS O-acetylase OafA/YrhL, contains acyltransferase and SGNH-hydrolase domains [Pseudomonas sp. NFPP07]